ncbi:hypothetical protein PLICRDRAFT_38305 [Plicaturopsis crispa FD-325 SS-3]|nr:hypothetical protein PLICRDRAFT_38305 [Plicaturopsis crispa FD-325 SS-3]
MCYRQVDVLLFNCGHHDVQNEVVVDCGRAHCARSSAHSPICPDCIHTCSNAYANHLLAFCSVL